jgi:hypothetical protein
MPNLHTYRFRFNNGSEFKTNASALNYALSNLHTTFSDSEIQRRGGLLEDAEVPAPQQERTYSLPSVAAHIKVPVKILREWIRLDRIDAEFDSEHGTVMTEAQVQKALDYKRELNAEAERRWMNAV